MFDQTHQQHLRFGTSPVIRQVILCLCTNIIVGRLQGREQLSELCMCIWWKNRHIDIVVDRRTRGGGGGGVKGEEMKWGKIFRLWLWLWLWLTRARGAFAFGAPCSSHA